MGDTVYDLVKPTRDLQKIMSSIHGARIDNDSMSILDALEMADEFLGNNIMYNRIVVFAGGPVYWFKHQLRGIGTKLKEKGVAVDVINFGDKDGPRAGRCEDWRDVFKDNRIPGESKKGSLEALVTAANHNDNSHILHVPEDQLSLRDHLSRSRVLEVIKAYVEEDSITYSLVKQFLYNDFLDEDGEDFILHYLPDLGEITYAFDNLIMNEIFESAFDKKFPGLQYYRFLNEVLINCTSMEDEIAFDEIAGYFFLEEVNLPGYIVSIGPGDSAPLSLYNNIFHLQIDRDKDVIAYRSR
ncbi:26S proteasome non-ATPase regulatory subunit 4 [Tanacetum coccineum]